MLLLSFRTAFRAIMRQRGYTLLNVLGLAIGLATCLIILTLVSGELRWDRSLDPDGQLYRLNQTLAFPNTEVQNIANTCSAFGPTMTERVPSVENFTRLWGILDEEVVQDDKEIFKLDMVFFADSTFFSMFKYPLVEGTAETALKDPQGIVLREDIAEILIPERDWLGHELRFVNGETVHVSGVYRVPDPGSFFEAKAIFPMHASGLELMSWQDHSWTTFFKLSPGTNPGEVVATAQQLMTEREDQESVSLWLQPFSDIHLRSNHVSNQLNLHPGDYRMVAGFSMIALLILVLAAINYINISTAAAIPRSHEVSLRKVMGASRTSLILQGLGESIGLAFVAMLFAVILCELSSPFVRDLVGRDFYVFNTDPVQLLILLGLPLLAGIGGGLYPALLLSSFHPVAVMKRDTHLTSNRGLLRRGLVTFQFVLSTALIIVTVALYSQLESLRKAGFGFTTDSVLIVENSERDLIETMPLLADRLRQYPTVEQVGVSHSLPSAGNWEITVTPEGGDDQNITHALAIDHGTAEVYGLHLLEGRWFDVKEFPADGIGMTDRTGASVVVNQKFVDMAGWDDAIGRTVSFWGMTHTVVGVIENFHQRNLYHPYHPMLIYSGPNMGRFVSIRTTIGHTDDVIAAIEKEWAELADGYPLNIRFADEIYKVHYAAELYAAVYLRMFAALAIFIASLGLLGLTAISATNRIREISIRKVLGANWVQILRLLNRDFLGLILLANLLAWLLAWWLINSWLTRFAVDFSFPFWTFPLSSVVIFTIAIVTISAQGARFTHIHPAKTLRHE